MKLRAQLAHELREAHVRSRAPCSRSLFALYRAPYVCSHRALSPEAAVSLRQLTTAKSVARCENIARDREHVAGQLVSEPRRFRPSSWNHVRRSFAMATEKRMRDILINVMFNHIQCQLQITYAPEGRSSSDSGSRGFCTAGRNASPAGRSCPGFQGIAET